MANYQKIDNSFTSYAGDIQANNISFAEGDKDNPNNKTDVPYHNSNEENENLKRKFSSQEEIQHSFLSPDKKSSSGSEEKLNQDGYDDDSSKKGKYFKCGLKRMMGEIERKIPSKTLKIHFKWYSNNF